MVVDIRLLDVIISLNTKRPRYLALHLSLCCNLMLDVQYLPDVGVVQDTLLNWLTA